MRSVTTGLNNFTRLSVIPTGVNEVRMNGAEESVNAIMVLLNLSCLNKLRFIRSPRSKFLQLFLYLNLFKLGTGLTDPSAPLFVAKAPNAPLGIPIKRNCQG